MTAPDHALDRRTFLAAGAAAGTLSVAGCAGLDDREATDGVEDAADDGGGNDDAAIDEAADVGADGIAIETVVDGLDQPWGLAFLPDEQTLLVTEIEGRLLLVDRDTEDADDDIDDTDSEADDGVIDAAEPQPVDGTPDVHAAGQGGLLDVTLHPEFEDEPWIYLTYAATNDEGEAATHVGRGRLDRETATLQNYERLHVAEPFVDSTGHYGSRAIFGEDGALYVTTGDRQFKDFGPDHVSQDRTNELGATLRLAPDGSIPEDNPFVDEPDAADAIYSYGLRNVQGATVHPETGELWVSDHGEEDGDEINVLEAGGNFGWPVAHTGCHYGTTDPVGDDPFEREDVVDPVYYWECTTGGFPPSGATFYDGDAFPEWQGDLFVGNLAGQYLGHFAVDDADGDADDDANGGTDANDDADADDAEASAAADRWTVGELDPLLADRGWRIRDVAVAPDTGHLYVAIDDADAPIVRLVPA